MPSQRPTTPIRLTITRVSWALATGLILVSAVLLARSGSMKKEIERSRTRIAGLSRDLEEERRWTGLLSSSTLRAASFTLTPDADPSLRARGMMDPVSRRAVLVFEEFRAPAGKFYALWALHGNTPAALGRIRPDRGGRAVMRIGDLGDTADLSAFAVSLEPEGPAANEPNGPVVMIGSLGG